MGHSQDDISVIICSRRRIGCILASTVLGAIALLEPSVAKSQSTNTAERLRINTVRVQGSLSGFGFVVGQRSGYLYIVTARHVIVGIDPTPDSVPPKNVKIVFYSDQGTPRSAEVLGTHEGDLAVLRVAAPADLQWVRDCVAAPDSQNRGTGVWFVGRHNEWYVPVNPGTISSERPSAKSLIEIDGLSVSPGTSGAPLIASSGIVGMIESDESFDTRALTIDFIQRAVEEWNYPWDLTAGHLPQVPQSGEVQPAPQATCSLGIDSDPSGADIRLDGTARGETPGHLTLTQGRRYTVSLNLDGYKAYRQNIDCDTGDLNPKLEPQLATINVVYVGDMFACSLDLQMKIGNKRFHPTSNENTVKDVPLGDQRYTISGQIGCPGRGMCAASGSGSIDVQDGTTYNVQWANVAFGGCRVALVGN